MHFSRLYFKIFLAFIAVIIAAELVVYSVFVHGKPPPPFIRHVVKDSARIGNLIKKELTGFYLSPTVTSRTLKPLMKLLSKENMRIWVTDTDGTVYSSSFDGPPPALDSTMTPVPVPPGEKTRMFTIHNKQLKAVYLKTPIRLRNGPPLLVHIVMDRLSRREEEWFIKGLVLLTALSALFILPVSRGITRPLRKVSEAADRLGHGDFSQRVPVTGHDEVTTLADKFNKMANGLERMVMSGKELTAHLSHELRTPLTRMQISLQMAIEKSEEGTCGDSARYLSKIRGEIDNMDTIIGQILALSKLDLQQPPPRTDLVDVADRVHTLLETYDPMIEQRHLKIEENLAPTPTLLCLSHELDLLLDNILSNAMKYTDEYGTIAVTTHTMDNAIHIEVCNTHPLLTEKDLDDMFIPFQRLYRSRETGTGLGLASAKKIAELHGGVIHATYKAGRVCLQIVIPLQ